MTTPNPYPSGIDPVHVQIIAAASSTVMRRGRSVLLLAKPEAIRIYLPNRPATQAASDALQRVGYQVTTSAAGQIRNRGLLVTGWSTQGLESRLDAMRGVLQKLAAKPQATAVVALGQLSRVPAAELPGRADQQHLIGQLITGMRSWISATSGIHAPCDPRARPADPGCRLRLPATRRAEEAIDDLVTLQERVAQFGLALYPSLRQTMSHQRARDCILQWADLAFGLSSRIGQDTSALLRGRASTADAVPSPADAEPASASMTLPVTGPRRRSPDAGEHPSAGMPISRISRPPSVTGMARPRGRNSPSRRTSRRH
jgi:hypothetical protein